MWPRNSWKVLLSCCLLNCKVILLYAQNSQAFWVNILNYELALFCLQWKVSNQTLTRYRFLWKIHYLHVGTGLGNETGKSQNIKKKSTHEFFICLAINEKHMNSHFVLCQFENSVLKLTPSRWLPFRCTHSSSRDMKLLMTSHSVPTGIAATSSWIRCFKSMIVLGLVSNTFVFRYLQRK